jgi:hypothetical protein
MNTTPVHSPELSSRLIPLFDGRPGIRGTVHVEISEPKLAADAKHLPEPDTASSELTDPASSNQKPAARASDSVSGIEHPVSRDQKSDPSTINSNGDQPVLDFISSDDSLDRFGEIIAASGWRLENYRRNPVFQNAHQYGDVIFTLGRALITEVRSVPSTKPSTCLYQRIQFATDINPMARIAHGLYQGKFLNAVSVGFVPIRWENGGPKDSFRRKYVEQELLEVSAVAIPANSNALALGLKAGAIQRADLREASDLLRLALELLVGSKTANDLPSSVLSASPSPPQFCSNTPAGSNTDTRALGLRAFEAQLLQLARALKEALRH